MMTANHKLRPPRILIGVAGHRVLADEGRVTGAVDLALDRIEKAYGPSPLTILSPLASGADQLVARRVLARPGSRLIATLPMPLEQYLDDFPVGDQRRAFLHLLDQASETISLPPAHSRVESYEAVGQYLVTHCDLVIAIWDGRPARGRGGTAETVALARRRDLPLVWIRVADPPEHDRAPRGPEPGNDVVCYERFPPAS